MVAGSVREGERGSGCAEAGWRGFGEKRERGVEVEERGASATSRNVVALATALCRGALSTLFANLSPRNRALLSYECRRQSSKGRNACRRNERERANANVDGNWRSKTFFWSKLDSLTGTERRDAHRPSAPRRPAGSCSRRFQRRRRPARGGDRRMPGERGERRHRGNEKSERASESKSRKERKKVPSGSCLFLRHSFSLSLSSPVFAVLGSRERKRRVSHGSSISMMLQENASRLL